MSTYTRPYQHVSRGAGDQRRRGLFNDGCFGFFRSRRHRRVLELRHHGRRSEKISVATRLHSINLGGLAMTYSAFYVAEFPAFGYFPNNVLSGYSLCGASNRHRLSALFRCAAQGNQKNRPGRSMHEVNDAQWLAFEALAKTYPNDNGVRLTADLARWLVEEYQRQKLPVAPIVQRVVHSVTQELQSFSSRAAGPNQLATK
jgi:hypothetical protein